jgi:putative FmdB family regulatory protein
MPLMEYTCEACDLDFETLLLGSERAECPDCASVNLVRRWSLPARPTRAGGTENDCPTEGPPCHPACCRLPSL